MKRQSPPPPSASIIYRLTRWVAYVSLRLFYRRVDAVGGEHVPASGPVVLVANHPNYMVDPLVLGVLTQRQVHFAAKGPLLDRYPILSRFLRGAGALPIFRPQDDPSRTSMNREAFARCADLLEDGGMFGIFAEGVSHDDHQVRRLRTGAARIVLEAEARNAYALGVHVVPVGIYFPEEDRFFSDGLVVFGAPMDIGPLCERHATDPQGAVRALTAAMQDELRRLTLHVPDTRWVEFVTQMRDLLTGGPGSAASAADHLRTSQITAAAAERHHRADGGAASRFRLEVAAWWEEADALQRHVTAPMDERTHHLGRLRRTQDASALPVAALGVLFNAPPFLLARGWAERFVQRREKRAFIKFLVGTPSVVAWYGLMAWWLSRRLPAPQAAALVGLGIGSGALALRLRVHGRRWTAAWQRPDQAHAAARRAALERERRRLAAEFAEWTTAPPNPVHTPA